MQLFDVKKLDDSCAWSVDCVFCYIRVHQWFMSCKNIVCVCGNFFLLKSFLANCFQFPQRVVLFEVPREFKYCNKLNSITLSSQTLNQFLCVFYFGTLGKKNFNKVLPLFLFFDWYYISKRKKIYLCMKPKKREKGEFWIN